MKFLNDREFTHTAVLHTHTSSHSESLGPVEAFYYANARLPGIAVAEKCY